MGAGPSCRLQGLDAEVANRQQGTERVGMGRERLRGALEAIEHDGHDGHLAPERFDRLDRLE